MPIFMSVIITDMATDTKHQRNGKAAQGAAQIATETKAQPATHSEQQGAELTDKQTPYTPEAPVLSVEDKIRKVETLNELIQKRTTLKNHQERVEKLKFGDYEEKDTLTIHSGNGQNYTIKSAVLCQKIAETEAQIAF
jgi:hypothetical protein